MNHPQVNKLIVTACCACIGVCTMSVLAWAQVERPAASSSNAPLAEGRAEGGAEGMAGGMAGGRNQQAAVPPDPAVIADLRNLSGLWKVDNTATAGGVAGMAAGASPAAGQAGMAAAGMSGGAPASGMTAGTGAAVNAKSSGLLCIPDKNIFGGGDGGLEVIQTAAQITLVAEENHRVRRIYLNGEHPKTVKPSFMGHSVGHWEGDTLVVDTIGLRSGTSGTIDRIRKIDNGLAIEVKTSPKNDPAAVRTTILRWNARPIVEWICEDYTDEFFKEDYK